MNSVADINRTHKAAQGCGDTYCQHPPTPSQTGILLWQRKRRAVNLLIKENPHIWGRSRRPRCDFCRRHEQEMPVSGCGVAPNDFTLEGRWGLEQACYSNFRRRGGGEVEARWRLRRWTVFTAGQKTKQVGLRTAKTPPWTCTWPAWLHIPWPQILRSSFLICSHLLNKRVFHHQIKKKLKSFISVLLCSLIVMKQTPCQPFSCPYKIRLHTPLDIRFGPFCVLNPKTQRGLSYCKLLTRLL